MNSRTPAAPDKRDVDLDEVRRRFRFAREQLSAQSSTAELRSTAALRHWRESQRRVDPSDRDH
jgi:hypothetical protein